jgi:hypothetical protein
LMQLEMPNMTQEQLDQMWDTDQTMVIQVPLVITKADIESPDWLVRFEGMLKNHIHVMLMVTEAQLEKRGYIKDGVWQTPT